MIDGYSCSTTDVSGSIMYDVIRKDAEDPHGPTGNIITFAAGHVGLVLCSYKALIPMGVRTHVIRFLYEDGACHTFLSR